MAQAPGIQPVSLPDATPGRLGKLTTIMRKASPRSSMTPDMTLPLSVFDIEKEGWLQKQSRHLGVFRHRWMVLEGNYLYSFKNEKDYNNPTEIIDLSQFTQAEIDPTQPLRFSLQRKNEDDEPTSPKEPDFIFFSTSLGDAQDWANAINRVVFLLSPVQSSDSAIFATSPANSIAVTLTSVSSGVGASEVPSSVVEYSHASATSSVTSSAMTGASPPRDNNDDDDVASSTSTFRRRRMNPMQAIAERRDQILEKMNRVSSIRELEAIREEFSQIHRDIHRLTIEKTNKEDEVDNLRTRVRDLKIAYGMEDERKTQDRNSLEYLRRKKQELDAKAKSLWDEYLKVRAEADELHERITALRQERRASNGSRTSSVSGSGSSNQSGGSTNVVLSAKMSAKLNGLTAQLEDVEIEFTTLTRLLSESNLSDPEAICETLEKLFNDKRSVLIANVKRDHSVLRGWRSVDLAAYLCLCDAQQFGRYRVQIGNIDDSSSGWMFNINEHTLMSVGIVNVHEGRAILKTITELTNSASL